MSDWAGLLPKSETQSLQFVIDNPACDGKGIIVGILDTGVDPAAEGLSVTSDGRPKVIDVVDCTGSGDVVMSELISANTDSNTLTLPASSGEPAKPLLLLNSDWTNPSGKYRYGVKRLWDFYSRTPKAALKASRQVQHEEQQRAIETRLQHALAVAQGSCPVDTAGGEVRGDVEDIKAKLALLKSLDSSIGTYIYTLYICIHVHDFPSLSLSPSLTPGTNFAVLSTTRRMCIGV